MTNEVGQGAVAKAAAKYVDSLKVDRKVQVVSGAGILGILAGAIMGTKTLIAGSVGCLAAGIYLGLKAENPALKNLGDVGNE